MTLIYFNSDSAELNPFEQFGLFTLDKIDVENNILSFKSLGTPLATKAFSDSIVQLNSNGRIDISMTQFSVSENSVNILLKTVSKSINRTLGLNKMYKIIYAYEVNRDIKSSTIGGYYIVDIVPIGDRFENEKGKLLSYNFKYELSLDAKSQKIVLKVSDLKSQQVSLNSSIDAGLISGESFGNDKVSFITGYNLKNEIMDGDYGDLIIADFNFDDLEDVAIKYDLGNAGCFYKFYLQNTLNKFEEDSFLSNELGHIPTIDTNNKALIYNYRCGANCSAIDSFKYNMVTKQFSKTTKTEGIQ